jgi:hypothetical protein
VDDLTIPAEPPDFCKGSHMQDPKAAGIKIQLPDLLYPLTSLEIMITEHKVSFSSSLEPLS